ncbi:EamA family transporter [Vibrio hibernica]|uniref:EamA family transporter n=1 Tax=Vibrio hibernica TaxID=2587465 RepID=UPI00187E9E0E|nr:EamA family transporter [Vibrio hibernica]
MDVRSLLLILLVVFVWGINFVIITVGLQDVPPFFMAGSRFIFVALPLIFFCPKPAVPWRWIIAYGLTISFGQFAFLFYALHVGMPSGQASLILQMQVFVTAILGVLIYQDKINKLQIIGGLIALGGVICLLLGVLETHITFLGYFLTLCAACSWGIGNLCNRTISMRYPSTNMVHLVVWAALVPVIPFSFFSYLLDDHNLIIRAVTHPSLATILTVLYLAFAASLFGYSAWGAAIAKHGTANVVPFALLVPVIGLFSGWIILDETLNNLQFIGCGIVILGLCIYIFNQKIKLWVQSQRKSDLNMN